MRNTPHAPESTPSSLGSPKASTWRARVALKLGEGVGSKAVLGGFVAVCAASIGVSIALTDQGQILAPTDLAGNAILDLQAAPVVNPDGDFDLDGISDEQEEVLGLKPFLPDTDGDGFNDGEEIARQSDPFDESSLPVSAGISASLTARGGASETLRLVIVLHEPAGEIGQSKIRIGALTATQAVSVPISRFIGFADILEAPGSDGSKVSTIEIPLQAGFVHANEHVTFFLAAGNSGQVSYDAGAKIDVRSTDGVLQLLRPAATNGSSFQGGASIRQPIPPATAPSIPSTWIPGSICYQRAVTVGGSGAVVVKQIIEADCLQGFDSYCASTCSDSVGSTYRTIDPGIFIGG